MNCTSKYTYTFLPLNPLHPQKPICRKQKKAPPIDTIPRVMGARKHEKRSGICSSLQFSVYGYLLEREKQKQGGNWDPNKGITIQKDETGLVVDGAERGSGCD